jgi:hypothetical protein
MHLSCTYNTLGELPGFARVINTPKPYPNESDTNLKEKFNGRKHAQKKWVFQDNNKNRIVR